MEYVFHGIPVRNRFAETFNLRVLQTNAITVLNRRPAANFGFIRFGAFKTYAEPEAPRTGRSGDPPHVNFAPHWLFAGEDSDAIEQGVQFTHGCLLTGTATAP